MRFTLFFLLITTFFTYQSSAQSPKKMNFDLQKKFVNARQADHEIALFVKGNIDEIRNETQRLGGVFKYAAGDIAAIRIPLSKIHELGEIGSIVRIESNDLRLQPMNDQLVVNNHVQEVHYGFNLPQGYDGSGVVVGIIDEGIDFTHPDFRDEFGRTRIRYLWDQGIINFDTSTQAQPYGYGKEFLGNQIDTSTQHYDSQFSHGSHVAGIACGSGIAVNNYKGVAPKSDMVVVKMNLNQADNDFLSSLVDAVKYIFDRADDLNMPVVINISLGTYFGSHDAKDIQAQAIDNLISAKPGRVIVCSAGNAGTAPLHLGYEMTNDTSFTWFQYSSQGIYMQLWGDSGDFQNAQFSVGIDRIKPDYSYLGGLPFQTVLNNPGVLQTDTLYRGTDRMGIVQSLAQSWNGTYSMEYFIIPDSVMNISGSDTSRYYWRLMSKGAGRLDTWSLDMIFDNLPDTTILPSISKYKKPDNQQTIVSSFTCSEKVITVGSYINRNFYTNANFSITRDTSVKVGQLSGFSSLGPTRDGRIKPDITATGEWVLSCARQDELNILSATEPEKVAAGKKHKRSSGTSMASPVVAGIAALYLQKNPNATWEDVKNAITSCADRDAFTGNVLPDNSWGYGKVNGYGVVKGCTVGIDELDNTRTASLSNYPNPSKGQTMLQYDLSVLKSYRSAVLKLHDAFGRNIRDIILTDRANTIDLDLNDFASGIYTCTLLIDGNQNKSIKIMVY
ncbi:MAG: S8 family peptidase [Bacteroidia bacterium]|nr:S8 family peptidase [Bacteroidia bacterium]